MGALIKPTIYWSSACSRAPTVHFHPGGPFAQPLSQAVPVAMGLRIKGTYALYIAFRDLVSVNQARMQASVLPPQCPGLQTRQVFPLSLLLGPATGPMSACGVHALLDRRRVTRCHLCLGMLVLGLGLVHRGVMNGSSRDPGDRYNLGSWRFGSLTLSYHVRVTKPFPVHRRESRT